jgi:hypothetical protein
MEALSSAFQSECEMSSFSRSSAAEIELFEELSRSFYLSKHKHKICFHWRCKPGMIEEEKHENFDSQQGDQVSFQSSPRLTRLTRPSASKHLITTSIDNPL